MLSICIPTFNRAEYLKECLTSVLLSIAEHEHEIEIVISDNASADDTGNIVHAFQDTHPWIRYHRNEQNIGAERNFYHLAKLAQGENIWIFGDDDIMEVSAVSRVLDNICAGYDLTICNYSLWDKQFVVQLKANGLDGEQDQSFDDSNALMERFGLHLGYISCVVIKRRLFLKLPSDEYESFTEYGFPFLFAVYYGVANDVCNMSYVAESMLRNRGGNSGDYDWYKYFVTGSSLIFDELLQTGYTKMAVCAAKQNVLTSFVIPNMIGMKLRMSRQENSKTLNLLFKYYKHYWQFWVYCLPITIAPSFLLRLAKNVLKHIRRLNGINS